MLKITSAGYEGLNRQSIATDLYENQLTFFLLLQLITSWLSPRANYTDRATAVCGLS
jgi:hypothetical protein